MVHDWRTESTNQIQHKMKYIHTTFALCTLILFSGMNCHNRAADRPQAANIESATTWAEIRANSDAIDSALNAVFSDLETSKQVKKTMVRKRALEIVAPAGPSTFIIKDTIQHE